MAHASGGVGAVDPGDDRDLFDDGQYLAFAHLHNNRVGIPVSQKTGTRAETGHAVTPGIINHNQIRAAALRKLGGDSCARANG